MKRKNTRKNTRKNIIKKNQQKRKSKTRNNIRRKKRKTFNDLMKPNEIVKKINSYSHTEHNIPLYNDSSYIEKCINNQINFLDKNDILVLNNSIEELPDYVKNNQKKFDEWIVKK